MVLKSGKEKKRVFSRFFFKRERILAQSARASLSISSRPVPIVRVICEEKFTPVVEKYQKERERNATVEMNGDSRFSREHKSRLPRASFAQLFLPPAD